MAEWFVVGLVVAVIAGFIAAYARRRAREDIIIAAEPARVWSAMTGYRHLPEWQPETEQVVLDHDGRGWTETHKDGLRYRYRVERVEPPRFVRWRYEAVMPGEDADPPARGAGGGRGAGGSWTITLDPKPGGCRVRSRIIDRRSGSLWSRTLNALRGPRSHQGMYLECLRAHVEAQAQGAARAGAEAPPLHAQSWRSEP